LVTKKKPNSEKVILETLHRAPWLTLRIILSRTERARTPLWT